MTGAIVILTEDDDEPLRKAISRLMSSVELSAEDFSLAKDFPGFGWFRDLACLILDIRLLRMGGLDLQSWWPASNCRITIIFISARSNEQARARAFGAGRWISFKNHLATMICLMLSVYLRQPTEALLLKLFIKAPPWILVRSEYLNSGRPKVCGLCPPSVERSG